MTDYFQNPDPVTAKKAQYRGKIQNAFVEFGCYSFTTYGLTVAVPCGLSKVYAAIATVATVPSANEVLYVPTGVVSGGAVTVTRSLPSEKYQEYHWPIDNGQFASDDLTETPLMIASMAMTFTQVELYEGTAITGTPLFDLGVAGFAGVNNVLQEPTSEVDGSTTTCTIDTAAVASGAMLSARTTGGTGGTGGDWAISAMATLTLTAASYYTSGLTFNYLLVGTY